MNDDTTSNTDNLSTEKEQFEQAALHYHEFPRPGKISVTPIKQLANQRDLALAYSPGVAVPCLEIQRDPKLASKYTARNNLVGVITNGTAVLGLGNIGPLASKPVMEGKGVLFKKFAGIDVFDIEIAQNDPDKFIEAVASLEPTFGGINLEDIKAPECFKIERVLRERMNIPVFHDDQHGTSIIVAAAMLNALLITGKKIEEIKIVCSGAGAAAISCLDIICALGVNKNNIIVSDSRGIISTSRENLDETKQRYARDITATSIEEVMDDVDMFLGLSMPGTLSEDMVRRMAKDPIVFALANPTPEIMPELAHAVRPDVIMATGRSDYPNQVNNALCFPYIFRGALDVGATTVNEEMKVACVKAIAAMAHVEATPTTSARNIEKMQSFGRDYLIPGPLEPNLIIEIASAVAKAAMDSGVATLPIDDMQAYRQRLSEFVYNSAFVMKPIFARAKADPKRIVYCEGEDNNILLAVQVVVDEKLAQPILVGRPSVIEANIKKLGLRLKAGENITIVNVDDDPRYKDYWQGYYEKNKRRGVSIELARRDVRRKTTLIGSLLVENGAADGMVCGTFGHYQLHLKYVESVIGKKQGMNDFYAMNAVLMQDRNIFIADTYVHEDPTAEQLAEMTVLATDQLRRFGITPRVALVSHSNFGASDRASAVKMRKVHELLTNMNVDFEFEGEMQGDAALNENIRLNDMPSSPLKGAANLLILPTLDASNIAFNLLKTATGSASIGPILLGTNKPVHILTPSATARGIVNMTALTVTEAQDLENEK
ncbi:MULTISPECIES: NADP-dependent malic enzyme [Psychrobacter]|uniref:NADP-dependent malic enzyme n=1 Tax=Psychrobacter TaxID=497 RepID=UPI000C32B6F5|nr:MULTISPECIES: NADP-dependent malic enzyme [Psychrobacter]MBA6243235.1 NADP-dependent malic enzyme [Psychrobacter sp. Urea-trap-18]MBA6286293.1 NADP-dependent malic enzyme [Psychrobacter sp. Urea-trap-16]MBA6317442.1 NADP-dependent malic enzyme [Psychrobacter sp. Urea-trap-20]MBA6334530.1 NADP-dependent malic enzyme [Psychrobacter sp. Urea-trap-19]MCG3841217.1 NADP-dependent malic enzyme [Psychrobacter sp. Ps1]